MGLLNVIELFLVVSTEQLQRATASSGKKVDLVGDLVSGLKMQLSIDKQENNMPRDQASQIKEYRLHGMVTQFTDLGKEI